MHPPSSPSAPPDPQLVAALERATCKGDIRHLLHTQDTDAVMRAWQLIPPVQRSALLLARLFEGTIIHDDPHRQPDAV